MKRPTLNQLRCLYGVLLAIACAGWFVDPAISLIVALACLGAAGMTVTEYVYTVSGATYRELPVAVALVLAGGLVTAAVACYFIDKRIEWPSGLLGMAIYCFRAAVLARVGVAG